jgi:hypothetical protein
MRVVIALAAVALLGCGNPARSDAGGAGGREADYIAHQFDADCRSISAPNPKAAKELDQLCTCSTKQIRSTIRDGDSREVTDKKIDQARTDCLRKVYPNG